MSTFWRHLRHRTQNHTETALWGLARSNFSFRCRHFGDTFDIDSKLYRDCFVGFRTFQLKFPSVAKMETLRHRTQNYTETAL